MMSSTVHLCFNIYFIIFATLQDGRRRPANRIFNKFEPQKPPSIAGINPPKAALGKQEGDQSQQQQQHQRRLQRKVILPAAALDQDDDEELVQDLPGEGEEAEGAESPSSVTSPIMEDNFVASVLADMSGLVLGITADATDAQGGRGQQEEEEKPERENSPTSPSSASPPTSMQGEVSPTLDRKTIKTEPGRLEINCLRQLF